MCSKIVQKRNEINDAKKPNKTTESNSANLKTTFKNIKTETIDKIVTIQIHNLIRLSQLIMIIIYIIHRSNVLQNKISNNKMVLRTDGSDKYAEEFESMKTELGLSNDKLKMVETELSNEKTTNLTLMSSYVTTLERCKELESDVRSGKEKLEDKTKELENALVEKSHLLKQYTRLPNVSIFLLNFVLFCQIGILEKHAGQYGREIQYIKRRMGY